MGCCEDNSLLKDIVFSDPMENWNGSTRCCMSKTKLRKLSDVDEKLTSGDYDNIGQEIGKLAPAKQVEKCEELGPSISKNIQTCKDAQKKTQLEEERAVEAAKAAASNVETASENAKIQMKTAENATIAAETAQTAAETSKVLDEIKTAKTTAHKASAEKIKAENALATTKAEAAKAGSKK